MRKTHCVYYIGCIIKGIYHTQSKLAYLSNFICEQVRSVRRFIQNSLIKVSGPENPVLFVVAKVANYFYYPFQLNKYKNIEIRKMNGLEITKELKNDIEVNQIQLQNAIRNHQVSFRLL